MTDKSEIAPVAPPPTAVPFLNAAQGLINTGPGIQIGTNAGTMNFNFNGLTPEMITNLIAMFSAQAMPQKASYMLEWASLSTTS